ncbi:MAG: hypothetical protein JWO36_3146 [Myxococcales bacterium]|nr:hypothetical protein [Myxococcales bacterium]
MTSQFYDNALATPIDRRPRCAINLARGSDVSAEVIHRRLVERRGFAQYGGRLDRFAANVKAPACDNGPMLVAIDRTEW